MSIFGGASFPTSLDTTLIRLSPRDHFTLDDAVKGVLVTGGTGAGKTTGTGDYLASTYLSSGFGFLVCCVKQGEAERFRRLAARAGRSSSVVTIDGSARQKINFLQYQMSLSPDSGSFIMNTVNMLSTVIDAANGRMGPAGGDGQFWQKAMREALTHCLSVLWAAHGQVNLYDLFAMLQSRPMDQRQVASNDWQASSFMAHSLRLARDQPKHRMHDMDMRGAIAYLTQTLANPDARTTGNIIATISADLSPLMQGTMRSIFCEGTSIVPEFASDGGIILLDLPYEIYGDAGLLAQQLFKYLFQKAMLKRVRTKYMRPVALWCDEAHFVTSPFDNEYQSLAREARGATVYLTQNLPALMARIGGQRPEDSVHGLFGNFNTKVAHSNTDHKTNQWFADMVGKGIRYRANVSSQRGGSVGESVSDGNSFSASKQGSTSGGNSSYSRNGNLSWSETGGFSEQMDYYLQPGDFARLRTGGRANGYSVDGIVYKGGTIFRQTGRTFLPVTFKQRF